MVGMEGVEPPRLAALGSKPSMSTSSITSPAETLFYMTKARIKPKTAKINHIIASFWLPFLKAIYERIQKITGETSKNALPINITAGTKQTIKKTL